MSQTRGGDAGASAIADWARQICLGLPNATMDAPFGPESEVYRLHHKVFALVLRNERISEFTIINLKADPQEIALLIDANEYVIPGYHMNKKHWVSVILGPGIDRVLVEELIEDSYDYVSMGLPVALRPVNRGSQASRG